VSPDKEELVAFTQRLYQNGGISHYLVAASPRWVSVVNILAFSFHISGFWFPVAVLGRTLLRKPVTF